MAHILIVEDSAFVADLYRRFLSAAGHDPVSAPSLAQAILHLKARTPDLIVTDVGLPDGDGLSLLDEISNKDTPIIVVTAGDHKDQALARGAAEALTKPVTRDALVAAVNRALSDRQAAPPKNSNLG